MSSQAVRIPTDATLEETVGRVNRWLDVLMGNRGGRLYMRGDDGHINDIRGGALLGSGAFTIDASSTIGNHENLIHSDGVSVVWRAQDAGVLTSVPMTAQSTLGVTGAATLGSTLGVAGAATLGSTLAVTGATTLGNTLAVTGAATLSSTLGVTGATTLSSTLAVTGATTLSSTLAVTGAATLSSTLAVTGASTLTGAVTAQSTLAVTGAATFAGAVTLGDAAADAVAVTGTMTVAEILTLTKGLVVDTNTLVVDAVNNKVGILQATPTATLTVNGQVQVTSETAISGGAGIELGYNAGAGLGSIVVYDRVGTVYKNLNISGLAVSLQASGTDRVKVDATGIGFFNTAPVARPAPTAAATDPATTMALANSLRTGLRALGLFS